MSLFATPGALLLLVVLPALWFLLRAAQQLQGDALKRFGNPAVLARTSVLPSGARRRTGWLRWVGLTAGVLALARPQWGRQSAEVARTGRDLIVALDLSRSMRAEDVGRDRLSLAKRLAWQLAAVRAGDRVGLVIFGGGGFLQLPPTSDFGTFQLFLEAASHDDIADPATDVAAGLRVAERVLRREGAGIGSRGVLLLTDGERSEGGLDQILELYRHARLPVFVVGIGTVEGSQIPADSGAGGPWHLDGIGRPVISRLAEEDLLRIAETSGGAYARWDDREALERLNQSLANLQARTLSGQPADEPTERYQWPLAVAVAALLVDLLFGASPRGRSGPRIPRGIPQNSQPQISQISVQVSQNSAPQIPQISQMPFRSQPQIRRTAEHSGRPIPVILIGHLRNLRNLRLAFLGALRLAVLRNLRPAVPRNLPARNLRLGLAVLVLSCTPVSHASRGRQLYEQGKYLEAYEAYQELLRQQGGPEVRFNAGNSLYRMSQYNEAARTWREAMSGPDRLRQQAYYNMGNAFVRAAEDANALSGYLDRAIIAYEEALRLDPTDRDAKWNLELALRKRGDVPQEGSRGRGGRADYGRGSNQEGYEQSREARVGAMAGGGQGADEGESVEEMNQEQARALLDAVERQQLSSHEGNRPRTTGGADRDW